MIQELGLHAMKVSGYHTECYMNHLATIFLSCYRAATFQLHILCKNNIYNLHSEISYIQLQQIHQRNQSEPGCYFTKFVYVCTTVNLTPFKILTSISATLYTTIQYKVSSWFICMGKVNI